MDRTKRRILICLLIVNFSLRPGLTGLGSLMKLIRPDMGLTQTQAGLLTTIPMLTFALFSPLTWRINSKAGTTKTVCCAFAFIIAGILIRSWCGHFGLYFGTVLIGVGIAFGNVLMPAMIKSEFPEKYALVTALSSAMLAIASGIASGINTPMANAGLGWRGALCIWAAVAFTAAVIWCIGGREVQMKTRKAAGFSREMLRNKIAWSVTLFLGLVALLFYSCASWLSTIFQFKGLSMETAGFYVSAFQMTGIVSSFLVPMLAGLKKDQRLVTFGVIGFFLAGIVLMALTTNPTLLLISALLAGIGCNGSFALSMAFIGFRARNGESAAELSSMSQSLGYVIAAAGPLGMGWINSLAGENWNVNLWLICGFLVVLMLVAAVCAKDSTV